MKCFRMSRCVVRSLSSASAFACRTVGVTWLIHAACSCDLSLWRSSRGRSKMRLSRQLSRSVGGCRTRQLMMASAWSTASATSLAACASPTRQMIRWLFATFLNAPQTFRRFLVSHERSHLQQKMIHLLMVVAIGGNGSFDHMARPRRPDASKTNRLTVVGTMVRDVFCLCRRFLLI